MLSLVNILSFLIVLSLQHLACQYRHSDGLGACRSYSVKVLQSY